MLFTFVCSTCSPSGEEEVSRMRLQWYVEVQGIPINLILVGILVTRVVYVNSFVLVPICPKVETLLILERVIIL